MISLNKISRKVPILKSQESIIFKNWNSRVNNIKKRGKKRKEDK